MAKNSRRKRHRILAWIAAGAMASVVALVIVAVVIMLRGAESPPSAVPPGFLPPGPTPSTSAQTPTGLPGCVLPRRADDLGSRNLGVIAAAEPTESGAVSEGVAAQGNWADRPAIRTRPGADLQLPTRPNSTIR